MFSEELVTIFKVVAIASNLFRVFDIGAAEESTLDLAVGERLKSRPQKRMKPVDPQPLRAFDGSCICGCRFTLAELKGSCPERKKGFLNNLQLEAKEHDMNPESMAYW